MKLSPEEIRLLTDLRDRGRQRHDLWNQQRGGLDRLIEAGCVTSRAVAIDTVLYEITAAGRTALDAATS